MLNESLPTLRTGSRTPTFLTLPAGELDYSIADKALEWVDRVGGFLFPWQRDEFRVLFARVVVDGRWRFAAYEAALICPRQNGKNEVLVWVELASVALLKRRRVIHSAHQFSTAMEHMLRMEELIKTLPELRKLMPAKVESGFVRSNGKEAIVFRSGARILFKARSRGGARGFSADLIVLDEAFDLSAAAIGAMKYTLRARPDPQVIYTSSAAHFDSRVMHSLRKRHEAGDSARFHYAEWGNGPEADLSDPETWYKSNPSLGLLTPAGVPLIEEQTMVNEWNSARHDPDLLREFSREGCGVPEGMEGDTGRIRLKDWDALLDAESSIVGDVSFALDVSPEKTWTSIAAAGRRGDGLGHVEVFERRQGTGWVVDFVEAVWKAQGQPFRLDPAGPAGSLIGELEERGVEVIQVSMREHAQGCGALENAVINDSVRHRHDPVLRAAVGGAKDRKVQDVWLWSRVASTIDITPLVAATLAWLGVPEVKESSVAEAHVILG